MFSGSWKKNQDLEEADYIQVGLIQLDGSEEQRTAVPWTGTMGLGWLGKHEVSPIGFTACCGHQREQGVGRDVE